MPEIWLSYGTSSVVLDIKFENLEGRTPPDPKILTDLEITSSLAGLSLTEDMLILALSSSRAIARVINEIIIAARAKGFTKYTVDVPNQIASALRSNLSVVAHNESEQISINRVETPTTSSASYSLPDRLKKYRTTIALSQTRVDPLFGFSGAPTNILRNFLFDKMAEAFAARKSDLPSPGLETEPVKIATASAHELGISQVIEVVGVAENEGISGIHVGGITEAFQNSTNQLRTSAPISTEVAQSKAVIASAGREMESHSTLHASLNSLWNCIPNVKEGGSAVLVAENRAGIGGGALQMFAEGRLKPEQIQNSPYIAGLEHLLFARQLKEKFDLGLLSSLPRYYQSSQLGFTAYLGMKDVLERLLHRHGKSTKCLVISDGDLNLPPLAL